MLGWLVILECLKELFLIMLVGALISILSAIVLVRIVIKVVGIDAIMDIEEHDEDQE